MTDDSEVEQLLTRLADGDPEAIERLFQEYAPFLRAVVRAQLSDRLRGKFDSADVVQSVWVQIARQAGRPGWEIREGAQLKALLATIARRRLATRIRQLGEADPATGGSVVEAVADTREPRASEVAQANDLWERLLELCPPEHHEILVLRRDGLPLEEIARRTGLHEGSVRRIIRRLSRDLALGTDPSDPKDPANP